MAITSGTDTINPTGAKNEGRSIRKYYATGAGDAMAQEVNPGVLFKLISAKLKVNTAPTTSESFAVTLDAGEGAAYDQLLLSQDLSAGSITALTWTPDDPDTVYQADDHVDFTYTNTDGRTWGLTVLYELV